MKNKINVDTRPKDSVKENIVTLIIIVLGLIITVIFVVKFTLEN